MAHPQRPRPSNGHALEARPDELVRARVALHASRLVVDRGDAHLGRGEPGEVDGEPRCEVLVHELVEAVAKVDGAGVELVVLRDVLRSEVVADVKSRERVDGGERRVRRRTVVLVRLSGVEDHAQPPFLLPWEKKTDVCTTPSSSRDQANLHERVDELDQAAAALLPLGVDRRVPVGGDDRGGVLDVLGGLLDVDGGVTDHALDVLGRDIHDVVRQRQQRGPAGARR